METMSPNGYYLHYSEGWVHHNEDRTRRYGVHRGVTEGMVLHFSEHHGLAIRNRTSE